MTSHCVASYIDIGRLLSLFYCYSVATKHSVAASLDKLCVAVKQDTTSMCISQLLAG